MQTNNQSLITNDASDARFLVIDTETTGLSSRFNKTLTVGLLLANIKKTHIEILDQNHIFIKHNHYNANKEALCVNKIDLKQHHLKAIPSCQACHQINNFIEKNDLHKTPLLGHNLSFDKGFLNALFDQGNSLRKFHYQSFDTMWIWRNLQKRNLVPQGLRSNLGTIAEFFDIDYTKAHDALADCKITAQVYHKMLKLI